jgi:hypothetical protein
LGITLLAALPLLRMLLPLQAYCCYRPVDLLNGLLLKIMPAVGTLPMVVILGRAVSASLIVMATWWSLWRP